MQKTLTFTDDALGQRRFQHLYDAVILGASKGQLSSRAQIRADATLQLKLEAVSLPTPPAQIDLRYRPECARTLMEAPPPVVVTVAEIERIEALIALVPWGGMQRIPIADLYDFLSSAPVAESQA